MQCGNEIYQLFKASLSEFIKIQSLECIRHVIMLERNAEDYCKEHLIREIRIRELKEKQVNARKML